MEQEGCRPGLSVPAMNTGQDIGAEARFHGMESEDVSHEGTKPRRGDVGCAGHIRGGGEACVVSCNLR